MKKCDLDIKDPLQLYREYHFTNLKNFLMNWIKWNGLPDSIDSRFFNDSLIMRGFCTGFKYKDGNIYVTDGAISGVDEYYRPTKFKSSNVKFLNEKRKIGEDCAVCFNTYDYSSPYSMSTMLTIYANRLAHIDVSVDTSVMNSRVAVIPTVNDEKEAIRVANMMKRIYAGEPTVLSYRNSSFDGEKGIDIFPIKSKDNIVVTELADARRNIMSDFYNELGIKNVAVDKKERTNLAEMDSNSDQLKIASEIFLEPRKRWCEEMNRIFGTNISVEFNKEVIANVNSTGLSAPGNDNAAAAST